MSWFDDEFGTSEDEKVSEKFTVTFLPQDNALPTLSRPISLTCIPSGRQFHVGPFETPSVADLRHRVHAAASASAQSGLGGLTFTNIAGDAVDLHADAPTNAVFMAASQFNCLEMISPGATPEMGITRYIYDPTQGPACAMSCAAGTLYRNYFCRNALGQNGEAEQINTAANLERLLENDKHGFWIMKNGYLLPTNAGMMKLVNERIRNTKGLAEKIVEELAVGVQWDTELSKQLQKKSGKRRVCQVYCSAVPVSYSNTKQEDWEAFARLVLTGAYEATILVGILLAEKKKKRIPIFLTAIGGGAFGNKVDWIADSMEDVLKKYSEAPVDVTLVHFRRLPKPTNPFMKIEAEMQQ